VASRRSIGFPVTVAVVLTVMVLALAVGWQILVFSDARAVARALTTLDWIFFVLGVVDKALIQRIRKLGRKKRFYETGVDFLDGDSTRLAGVGL